jgi:hypothetical protein
MARRLNERDGERISEGGGHGATAIARNEEGRCCLGALSGDDGGGEGEQVARGEGAMGAVRRSSLIIRERIIRERRLVQRRHICRTRAWCKCT